MALEQHLDNAPAVLLPPTPKAPDVISYGVGPDGQGVLRVNAKGPHARLRPIFVMLLEAGLVPAGEDI